MAKYIQSANPKADAEVGIRVIMDRLKAGYLKPGGHQNKAYEEADRKMLEHYLNGGT
jgi:hypothetical protein